jgi:hypothetical protein
MRFFIRLVSNAASTISNQLSKSFFEVRKVIDGSVTSACCGSLVVCVAIFGRDRSIDAFLTCRSDSSVSLTRSLYLFSDIDVVIHQYRDCCRQRGRSRSYASIVCVNNKGFDNK